MIRVSRWCAIAVAVAGLAIAPVASAAPVKSTGPTEGGACKVTGGANAGKTGTYDTTSDPGHTYCAGAGWATECGGYPDKCESARAPTAGFHRGPAVSGARAN